jgi:mannose-6-phosphate isomerase-like protein (cupin superfamily)
MDVFRLGEVAARVAAQDYPYLEFLRRESLSVGLYSLRVGDDDRQQPHSEDEVYYVISGRARVRIGGEEGTVSLGDTIFVAKTVEHRFFDIEEDLLLLVVFAPPEGSGRDEGPRTA